MAELARIQRGELVSNFDEAARAAKAMAGSRYFEDAKAVEQAMVKILAGHEMGFGPFASMTGIHVIKGKPSVGANLMAAAVKRHPSYDYKVRKMDDDSVVLEFFESGQSIGVSKFDADDARKAGTQNMGKFPRNMLFARAMSNGVKWYCPDVFNGNAVYTPEELGAQVDGEGNVIDVPVREIRPDTEPERADGTTERAKAASARIEEVLSDPAELEAPHPGDAWGREEQDGQTESVEVSEKIPADCPTDTWSNFLAYATNAMSYGATMHLINALRKERGTDGKDVFWKGARPYISVGDGEQEVELMDADACAVIWRIAAQHKANATA